MLAKSTPSRHRLETRGGTDRPGIKSPKDRETSSLSTASAFAGRGMEEFQLSSAMSYQEAFVWGAGMSGKLD